MVTNSSGSNVVDWEKLYHVTCDATLLLNRIIDKTEAPTEELQKGIGRSRKIGLGFMGLHDLLIKLGLTYDGIEGRSLAREIASAITTNATDYSELLGEREGYYDGYVEGMPKRRNVDLTMIAPTGTLSTLANCSSGIEPYYAPYYTRENIGSVFTMYCQPLKDMAEAEGLPESEILYKYSHLFKGANDIYWRDHILMQAAVQEVLHNNISKTINMSADATIEDVDEAYRLAWSTGCKGLTIYRDGSREAQVLSSVSNDANEGVQRATTRCTKATLPDTLRATRYKVKVGEYKVYVMITENDIEEPVEVFVKFPHGRDSSWDALCRSLSLSLRYGIPLEEVIKQLDKSVKVINDMPSQLARILKMYAADKKITIGQSHCPDCGEDTIYQEGCEKCMDCGWSKCS